MNVYPVYRENVVCSGIEEDIQDCQFIDDIETTDISTHLLTVNCLGNTILLSAGLWWYLCVCLCIMSLVFK